MAHSIETFSIDRKDLAEIAFKIRQKVFVEEQEVSPEEEYDEHEDISRHYLLFVDGQPAGTARWRFTEKGIKLERFAVLPSFRNAGGGSALLKQILDDVKRQSDHIYLHAQVAAMNLYSRAGFLPEGDLFYEANIPHYRMVWFGGDTKGEQK